MAFFHLVWSLFVAFGVAKPLMDWILTLHHFELQYSIAPFNIGNAALLIVLIFAVGYIAGWILGLFWNWFAKK